MNSQTVQREIALLRSYVVSVAKKDSEGAYKPACVARVRNALHEAPTKRFKGANAFLKEMEHVS